MNTLLVKVSPGAPKSVLDYYSSYTTHHEGDSGIDLMTPLDLKCEVFAVTSLNFGISCEMLDKEGKNISYYLYPRSSISKTPLILANSVGIIDSGYRGEIMAKVRNIPLYSLIVGDACFALKEGTKLFQICSPDLSTIKVKVVDELSMTSRDKGGFGSTDVK